MVQRYYFAFLVVKKSYLFKQGRHNKKAKQASTAAKAAEKERVRRAREDVRVGPLPLP